MSLLTTPEVAQRLGVTVTRVQQMITAGRLPAEKLGRDYVVKEDDLALVSERRPGRPPKLSPAEIETSTATTRTLNKSVRAAAEKEMGAGKKKTSK